MKLQRLGRLLFIPPIDFSSFLRFPLLQSAAESCKITSAQKRRPLMSEDFGPTFLTVTDEEGNELVLEFMDALEYNGQLYQAFFPAETEGAADDPAAGLALLKGLHEDGADILSTLDSDEELEAVYDLFMESLFDGEE